MKCTNKCLALLTALAVCFGATGCRDEAIAFSYNPDYKVSAFRISGDTGFETADAFASGLLPGVGIAFSLVNFMCKNCTFTSP